MSRFEHPTQSSSFVGRIFGSDETKPATELDDWLESTLNSDLKGELERDEDADFAIRNGSIVVFVHTDNEEPPHIEISAPLLETSRCSQPASFGAGSAADQYTCAFI